MPFFKRIFSKRSITPVSLEEQISTLAETGIVLNEGVGVGDFLISFDRESYEQNPYNLTLQTYGFEIEEEPWGRYFSDCAWNLDTECIEGSGSYAEVMENIVRITGGDIVLTDVVDDFDFDKPAANLTYSLGGLQKEYTLKVDNDWIDPNFVKTFLDQVTGIIADGRGFWSIDNGQALILFFISNKVAQNLNKLADRQLKQL